MGALSGKSEGRENLEDGELTFLGRVLAHLPVDLHLGKMVVLGYVFGCLDNCLIIGRSIARMGPKSNRQRNAQVLIVDGRTRLRHEHTHQFWFAQLSPMSLLHPSAASHSHKNFFAMPSMQHVASYR